MQQIGYNIVSTFTAPTGRGTQVKLFWGETKVGKKQLLLSVLAALAFALPIYGAAGRVVALENEAAPAKDSCVTASCHAAMGKGKFVHGPVAVGDCTSCHKQKAKHKFEPIADVGKLCSQCHEQMNTKKFVHEPVKKGTVRSATTLISPQTSFNSAPRGATSAFCVTINHSWPENTSTVPPPSEAAAPATPFTRAIFRRCSLRK